MSMPFQNTYTHRKVAESSARPCDICYKPSSSVLVTDENKDFFYVCPGHLKDTGFCTPVVDEAAVAAKKKKQEMEDEVARVKKEFEEKQRKKNKEKAKAKSKDKDKDDKSDDKTATKKDEEKTDDRVSRESSFFDTKLILKQKDGDSIAAPASEEEPRIFTLKKTFFQQRLDKKRNAEIARRSRERMQTPNLFPSVPRGIP